MRYLLILCFLLSGCAIPLQKTIKKDPVYIINEESDNEEKVNQKKQERNIILKLFEDSGTVLIAFEKLGCSIFDIAGFLNEYGKTDIVGFCDFLEKKYPFTQWQRWALDRDIFEPAKRNYKLLKRIK